MSSSPTSVDTPQAELRLQWSNPGDILSLLLLVGGDIVQAALAQLVGIGIPIASRRSLILITPVAFSFGWVAYAFTSLITIVGDNKLMPEPDSASIIVNCSNAFARENHSWILSRLLRDHEASHEVDRNEVSIRVDIFEARGDDPVPDVDRIWVIGWLVIVVQQVLAVIPWILYGDWAIFMVTVGGTTSALLTGALPQWVDEKWPRQRINPGKRKVVALTRGNGHPHVLVIVNDGKGWDFEALATAAGSSRSETRFILTLLTICWTMLLITVSGLHQHTWFLIGVGGLGMLQNIYAAGATRSAGAFNIHLEPYSPCPTIVGYRQASAVKAVDEPNSEEDPDDNVGEDSPWASNIAPGVMGALMKLEKELPKAGASLLSVFFPGGLKYEEERFKFNREKKFWKRAFRRMGKPVPRRLTTTVSSGPTEDAPEQSDSNSEDFAGGSGSTAPAIAVKL